MQEISHKKAVEKILNAQKIVFFCGAGVSSFPPSTLPLGNQIQKVCLDYFSRKLDSFNLSTMDSGELSNLPLEFLTGLIVDDTSKPKFSKPIAAIADYYRNTAPNRLHFLLAAFLLSKQNAHVITTNYDTGIERAANEIIRQLPKKYVLPNVYGLRRLQVPPDLTKNGIYKIHGCARLDPSEELVLTTTQEAAGLPIGIRKVLTDMFRDSLVVFMGYSVSEPDCMEALFETEHYDMVWVSTGRKKLETNIRAKTIIEKADKAYHLTKLDPFVLESDTKLGLDKLWRHRKVIDLWKLASIPKSHNRLHNQKGVALYKKLLRISGLRREQLLKAMLEGFFYLRRFTEVDEFLAVYETLKRHSRFYANYTRAGIIRDQNADWESARRYFSIAEKCSTTDFEASLAKKERLGQEILLAQYDFEILDRVQKELEQLVTFSEQKTKSGLGKEKVNWLRISGGAKKLIIQAQSYKGFTDSKLLRAACRLCDEAVEELQESRDINLRIDTERMKARLYLTEYRLVGRKKSIEKGKAIAHKTYLLFSLLGITMGSINSLREYTLSLILLNEFDEAEVQIKTLESMQRDSPDKLSKIKVIALKYLLEKQKRNMVKSVYQLMAFILASRHFTSTNSLLSNVRASTVWIKKFQTGRSA